MLDGDVKKLKLAHSLLLSLPGTPVIRFGEEIGMGEDLSLPERNSTRTPMQWSADNNGGFSSAERDQCIRPPVNRGKFRYHRVNVAEQKRDSDSLLRVTEQMVRIRRENAELGLGTWQIVETGDQRVLGHRCTLGAASVVAVHNLSDESLTVSLDLAGLSGGRRMAELLSDAEYETPETGEAPMAVGAFGYRWFRFDKES
jgi:maltose alpha-D-glucosyltransferase/alpha-amylase